MSHERRMTGFYVGSTARPLAVAELTLRETQLMEAASAGERLRDILGDPLLTGYSDLVVATARLAYGLALDALGWREA